MITATIPSVPGLLIRLTAVSGLFLLSSPCWCRAQAAASGPAAALPAAEQSVQLDAFEVKEDSDRSYGALNSNAITRFNVELDKLPISADVFTTAFMRDVGATSVEDMLFTYSAGVGYSTPDTFSNVGTGDGDHVGNNYIQIRGFVTPIMERDSLMPVGPLFNPGSTAPGYTSNFDIEKVEVIDGPQSLLYSNSGPGGIVNVVSKQARFDQPAFGELNYRIDQYGSKRGQLDFGVGTNHVAVRVAILDDDGQSRRVNIGREVDGYFVQIAYKIGNTTLRLEGEQTTEEGTQSENATLTTGNATTDSRTLDHFSYLLATGQAGANTLNAAGAPNASGALFGGNLNWGNLNSEAGEWRSEQTINTFETLTADSRWNSWLSSEFAVGYNDAEYDYLGVGSIYAPQDPVNPTGTWAIGGSPADNSEPARTKAIRFSLAANNDLFGGAVKSQTLVGANFIRTDAANNSYEYFQADSNFNVIVNPAVTTNNGRTVMPTIYFPLVNGMMPAADWSPRASEVTVNGVNYVRQFASLTNPSLVGPSNPLGLTASGTHRINERINRSYFAINDLDLLNGRLTILSGMSLVNSFNRQTQLGTPDNVYTGITTGSFDFGVNYELLPWLRAYATASDSYTPPEVMQADPDGTLPKNSRGQGAETGLKFSDRTGILSGSIAVYASKAKNEQYDTSSTLIADINPAGLNGSLASSGYTQVNRDSTGLQATLTANPTPNWRIRLSAADIGGQIENTKQYAQLYNDQFHENAAGDVTYADGTVVYVSPTFNAKAPVASSATPGAVPLTVALMNTASSVYYANPSNPSGAISSTSAVATVLKSVDPVHGAILTGAVGLPITDLQITPSFPLPGAITITKAGDKTLGYPQLSYNLTNVYAFTSGLLKGFEIGGTVSTTWKFNEYYYYPQGLIVNAPRQAFALPTMARFDLIAGYEHRFKRVTWGAQLNVLNLFNHYEILVLPDPYTGWTNQNNLTAAMFGSPRYFSGSSTIKF